MMPELVLLDRDGTLNVPPTVSRYVVVPEDVHLLPGAGEAVRLLNDADVPVVVVTNQRGLATGQLARAQVDAVHAALTGQLASCGAVVAGWYVCPHDVGGCDCRKPLPGLLLQAMADRPGLTADRCLIIGDAETDMLAGAALRMPGILLGTDPGVPTVAGAVHPSLLDAVTNVLRADSTARMPHGPTTHSSRVADC
jgi:D-glycero-D-manno-heptose 1,7-bisphosphate phosphatase